MRLVIFVVASLALLALCECAREGESIQHIPTKVGATQLATGKGGAESGAAGGASGASKTPQARGRRDIAGQESDLLPSANEAEVSPFGEASNFDGRGRIKVLPAYLG